jgi:gliding motility-associated-like protein
MFFVPPLSCETPKIIDNIPFLNELGITTFVGRVTLVTETGSTLNFVIDATAYTLAGLPSGVVVNGPLTVTGNPGFVTYTITGLSGNVSVFSTSQLYLASYGSFDAATFGGFYSGFTFKPAISFEQIDLAQPNCLPNIQLSVNEVTGFDSFEWYFNNVLISTASSLNPTQPGYYYVKATIADCGTTLNSDIIPVSSCVTDADLDGVNDNVDLDNDNDGINNCDESHGDLGINLSNPAAGNFNIGSYSNSFTGSFPPGSGPPAAVPFTGYGNGNFVTETSPGKGNSVIYKATFAQPVSIAIEYVATANSADLLNSNAEFVISSPVTTTISVLNPTNQLLIDTNYDGIYESDVTEYSSFEIRFRVNSTTPLAPGSGTFRFLTSLVSSVSITHKNLLDNAPNKATFRLLASCVPMDTDGDGTPDQLDLDSDNDAVPDIFESQGGIIKTLTGTDSNSDGLDDVFANGSAPADTDNDGVFDYIDLDSDNDGIYDVIEAGTSAPSSNGTLNSTSFGSNGLSNNIQSPPGSGQLNYIVADTDGDGIVNASESDSDGDGCSDVREAGFSDSNNDGYLGGATTTVNSNGVVTGAGGYVAPDANYTIPVPILITQQASDFVACETRSAIFSVQTNPGVTYQWQRSVNGSAFTNLTDNAVYSGVTTSTLTVNNITPAMSGHKFRVVLSKVGNVCGLEGNVVTLSVNPLPATLVRDLVQCDTGAAPDGITLFNLSQADFSFTNGDPNFSVDYFESVANAESNIGIPNNVYTNVSNPQAIVARLTDSTTGCFSYSTLNLITNLLPSPTINIARCDDDGTEDGFYQFDLTPTFATSPGISYYETENDALLEQNEISNPASYVNHTPYQLQTIYVRSESANDCTVITMVNIKVNPLPDIDANLDLEPHVVCVNDIVFTTTIDAALQDGTSPDDYSYQWFFEGVAIPNSDSYTLTLGTEGTYTVEVTDLNGCTKIRTVPVIASSTAIIEDIDIVEMSDNNTVTITLSDNSYGNYVYSLDYPNAYQQSSIFTNVLPGFHTVYVKDVNGCPVTTQQISILGIPKYFTPNGDGFHDTWNIQGVGYAFHPGTVTYIYDRYGKLLKQLGAAGFGWDGTFAGKILPSDDYWYVIKMEDGRIFKGHFALKR